MTSRFAVLRVRPAGKQSLRTAQEAGGGHYEWDGPAGPDGAGGTARRRAGPDRLLDLQPARHHTDAGPEPAPPADAPTHPKKQTATNLTKHL
ncbi:hypothetical protein OG883_16680 [Streptomyces sp. NBC_01142]|uniref:hypothetical protein n=1 Tax=Streptomyces sp. NBC_01142 TaxID=2975865 RepID=UPI00225B6F35|nr:hypothetical protein [Streptomyces sp. NBC_01142]MCX4821502.1 hypothetical protein [Streptomyces sp. NBC_01142]